MGEFQAKLDFGFRPLTFIKSDNEVLRQIENSVLLYEIFNEKRQLIRLGDALEKSQYGYTASATEAGNCQMLRITDIREGNVAWSSVPYCSCDEVEKYALRNEDILIARTGGTTGKTTFVQGVPPKPDVVFASYLIRLSVKPSFNPFFIFLFLNSYPFWNQILEMKNGSAQPNVNAEKMKTLLLPNCSKPLQDEIVAHKLGGRITNPMIQRAKDRFSKTKSLFESNRAFQVEISKQQDFFQTLRQTILQEAIEGKLTAKWREAHPVRKGDPEYEAAALLEQIKAEKQKLIAEGKIKKEKPLPPIKADEMPFELPKGWVWCRFSEICEISTNNASPFDYPSHPHIAPDNIEKNTGRLLAYRSVKEDKVMSVNHLFFSGMLLYSKVRPRLRKIVEVDFEGLCSADMYPLSPKIFKRYLKFAMLSDFFDAEVYKFDNRVKMPKINQDQLSVIPIPVPPLAEQHAIVELVDRLLEMSSDLEAQVSDRKAKSDDLMQAVLREAFEGNSRGFQGASA